MLRLTDHERRILAYLDQHGPTRRERIVFDLAAPDSKIGRARDDGTALGGGSSGNAEAAIFGHWSRRLKEKALICAIYDNSGRHYRGHQITTAGRERLRQIEESEPCAPAGVTSRPR